MMGNLEKKNEEIKGGIKLEEVSKDNIEQDKKNQIIDNGKNEEIEFTKEKQNIENNNESGVTKENKKKKPVFKIILTLIIILCIGLIISTIFAVINTQNTKILSGISINGIDVSNLSKEEAKEKLTKAISEKLSQEIILYYKDSETSIFPEQFSAEFDVDEAIDKAYEKGRGQNIFVNNFEILQSYILKINILIKSSYNEDSLQSLINEFETNFPDRLIETSYYIDGNNLIITQGTDGMIIDSDALKNKILSDISNLNQTSNKVSVPIVQKKASKIDIDKIYSEVVREPKDAYYTKDPFTVYPHVDGIDFAISIDEAKALITGDKESYTIALKVTSPKITTNQIGSEAFPDLLSSFSTTYSTKNVNRSTNIALATKKIDGIIIMPGETFSYNQTVGQRTTQAGFKPAAVYAGGQVTTGIGGGICQVSSTLYNAVLLANLEIVQRTNHGFDPGYVKPGRDATVSWGGPDFKFKNNREYPVKLICSTSKGTIYIKIFGLKTENEYEVEISSKIVSYISYKTIYQNNASMTKGTTKVIQNGSSGYRTETYKILKQNGKVISTTLISKDTYNPHNKIVAVGTKETSATPIEEPTNPEESTPIEQEPPEQSQIPEQTTPEEENP